MNFSEISEFYESKQSEYKKMCEELEKAKSKFNGKYSKISREGKDLAEKFTFRMYKYMVGKLNVSRSSHSETLSEIFLLDEGMEKISFHNKYYLSAYDPKFTFMIRDEKLRAYEGEVPLNLTPEQAGEFILSKYRLYKETYGYE